MLVHAAHVPRQFVEDLLIADDYEPYSLGREAFCPAVECLGRLVRGLPAAPTEVRDQERVRESRC